MDLNFFESFRLPYSLLFSYLHKFILKIQYQDMKVYDSLFSLSKYEFKTNIGKNLKINFIDSLTTKNTAITRTDKLFISFELMMKMLSPYIYIYFQVFAHVFPHIHFLSDNAFRKKLNSVQEHFARFRAENRSFHRLVTFTGQLEWKV